MRAKDDFAVNHNSLIGVLEVNPLHRNLGTFFFGVSQESEF